MKEKYLLLCDEDASYASALSGFLLSAELPLRIRLETEVSRFLTEEEHAVKDLSEFDLLLLTDPFLEVYDSLPKEGKPLTVAHLCEASSEAIGEYERIYKFQSMDRFLEKLRGMLSGAKEGANKGEKVGSFFATGGNCKFIALYAPFPLEIQLPVALLLGKMYASQKRTLFVDMQENSLLPELLGKESEHSLIDYLYLAECREQGEGEGSLSDYLSWYDELAYLPPVRNPSEISFITGDQWEILLNDIAQSDFEVVLLLFDRMHQGFSTMAASCSTIYLLTSQTGISRRSEKKAEKYLDHYGLLPVTRKIVLPKALCEFPESDYPLEELSGGRLQAFVQSCVGEELYAVG